MADCAPQTSLLGDYRAISMDAAGIGFTESRERPTSEIREGREAPDTAVGGFLVNEPEEPESFGRSSAVSRVNPFADDQDQRELWLRSSLIPLTNLCCYKSLGHSH